jgi:glutathione S-transferase
MKLHTSLRAPNPRRVDMFLAEKGVQIERVVVDLNKGEHRNAEFVAKNPLARVPVLELDDGRMLAESRAICTYLEGLYPEPNLMGRDATERAFIEMVDRQTEFNILGTLANWVRHSHPGLLVLENPQFPDFGGSQGQKWRSNLHWLESALQSHEFVAGDRFSIADITAFCAIEFARIMKFTPAAEGYAATQQWRDRIASRPSAQA